MIANCQKGEFGIAGDLLLEESGATRTEAGSVVIASLPEDANRAQWMRLTETSAGFAFWNHPDEDIYSEDDGEPV